MTGNRFSKGRIPKIGETVLIEGDPSVGIFPGYGTVVGVHDKSADIKFKSNEGDVVEELSLGEFRDEKDMEAELILQTSLQKDWIAEHPTSLLKKLYKEYGDDGDYAGAALAHLELERRKNTKGLKFSTRSDIEELIRKGKFNLNPVAQAYYEALEEADDSYGENGVKTQALYLANNLQPTNDEQEKLVREIQKIGGYEPERNLPENVIDEDYYGRLIDSELDFIHERKEKRLTGFKIGEKVLIPANEDEFIDAIDDEAAKRGGLTFVDENRVAKRMPQKNVTVVAEDIYTVTIKDDSGKEEVLPKEMITQPEELISLDDFKAFAEYRGIPLDIALKVNDYLKEYLTPEAREAVKIADKKIKVKGIDI